jgi:hypothetical protein
MLHNPEYRLTSRSGQDRSVNHKNYALETDKGYEKRRIYSPISQYNQMKCELTQMIRFHSAYGYVTVFADRSALPQTGLCLSMDSWKLRSLGKAPHILTYGLENLEGLRVGNSDALEVRVAAYYNYTCNAPGFNMRVSLSA